jgi:uncharacterized phage-associated protein
MTIRADAIANYFLDRAAKEGRTLDQMQVQKLVYFAQGWTLGILDRPLFDEDIEAWRWGPVIRSIRTEFKDFGANPITAKAKEAIVEDGKIVVRESSILNAKDPHQDSILAILDRVWNVYGRLSGMQLSNMTHAVGTPWYQVLQAVNNRIFPGLEIPKDTIKSHFAQQLRS